MKKTEISARPYLLRAIHDWVSDNNQTPLILVNSNVDNAILPQEYTSDGQIILNISWSATQNLLFDNEKITFSARFSGNSRHVVIPINAIQGIYSRESEEGIMFENESNMSVVKNKVDTKDNIPQKGRPDLKLIK
ncbi:MAG: ClpXP protease specificity-enhancing factor [Pseudomonadota bacterium]|nr:ClpXP protease specificity-enhancing factor [Pseudomonadota bacterium]